MISSAGRGFDNSDPPIRDDGIKNWVNCKKPKYEKSYMVICSQASGKTEEGSETRDTTVSPQRPTPGTGDDIVQSRKKFRIDKT